MLETLTVRTFKSLEDVTVELGLVNVFIGSNGSGKSNLLEALGVLSAAADGKVDDMALLAHGVRPGLPAQYRSAFPVKPGERIRNHLYFGASSARARYEVTLHNPLDAPAPAWRFRAELLRENDSNLFYPQYFPATGVKQKVSGCFRTRKHAEPKWLLCARVLSCESQGDGTGFE